MSNNTKGFLQRIGIPHHEYWPWWMLVAPVWPIWLWNGIRLKCMTWFTTVNPAIEDGGFMGESKIKILDLIPKSLKPQTVFIDYKNPFDPIIFDAFSYPIIAKPDIGGRGRKIEIIKSLEQMKAYHNNIGESYMVQEWIAAPLEVGVYYARIPSQEKGKVISLASKSFLHIVGDGISSIRDLMLRSKRAESQLHRLKETVDLNLVPKLDEKVLLEPIGNHNRGTKFVNEQARINKKLSNSFDEVVRQIPGFYYGRFDIRVPSWEDLEDGKNIKILELNGLTSDPAHIFDPSFPLSKVFSTQRRHIKTAYAIAKENLAKGVKPTPFKELFFKTKAALKDM